MKGSDNIRLTISNVIFYLDSTSYKQVVNYLSRAKVFWNENPEGQTHYNTFEFELSDFMLTQIEENGDIPSLDMLEDQFGKFEVKEKSNVDHQVNSMPIDSSKTGHFFSQGLENRINLGSYIGIGLSILGLNF